MIGFLTGTLAGKFVMGLFGGALVLAGAYYVGYTKGAASAVYKVRYAQALANQQAAERELANLRIISKAQEELAQKFMEKGKKDEAALRAVEDYIRNAPSGDCILPDSFLSELEGLGN